MPYKELHIYTGNSIDPMNPSMGVSNSPFVAKFKVLRAGIPLAYQSTDTSNNQIAFTRSGSTKLAQIPAGNYDSVSFPQALQTALNQASTTADFVVSYNSTSNRLTIASPSSSVSILPFSGGTTMYAQLGMTRYSSPLSGNTVTFSGSPNFGGLAPLLLTSSTLVSRDVSFISEDNLNIIAMIPVSSPQNTIQFFSNENGSYLDCGTTLSRVDFRLLNANTLLPVQMSQPYTVSLGLLTAPDDPINHS